MKHTRIILLIALLGAAAAGLPSARGATITVTEVGDGFDVHTNLRQALADANDGDTIEFDPLIGGRNLPVAPVLGQLVVNKSVTTRWVPTYGNSADASFGGGIYNDQANLTVSNCTISGNSAGVGGGGIASNWLGNGSATV